MSLYHANISTPIRKQYLEIKSRHQDAILLFRLGDFYEAFDDDAKLVARELNIALTSKPMGKNLRVPLAGIPFHSLERHLATLISRGYRVAICEQLTDAPVKEKGGKGLIARDVVRVVTAGTIIEPGLLKRKANNYLAAVCIDGRMAGIAYADVTTGEFVATETSIDAAYAELERIAPSETLAPRGIEFERTLPGVVTVRDEEEFKYEAARKTLLKHFGATTLAPFGLNSWRLATRAAGAIIRYLRETQEGQAEQLARLTSYRAENFLQIDARTFRALEIFESHSDAPSLLSIIDKTQTPMGGRLLRRWLRQPLRDTMEIARRQEHVAWLVENETARQELRSILETFHDMERLAGRVRAQVASPQEVLSLASSLEAIPRVRSLVQRELKNNGALLTGLPLCEESLKTIRAAINDELPVRARQMNQKTDIIRAGFSEELDSLRQLLRDGKSYLAEVERRERARTGIKSLRVGYNKVFGFYIEVTKPNLSFVPADYTRKQTLTNAERFITLELKEHETLVANAEDRAEELQANIFRRVCSEVGRERPLMLAAASTIAYLDAISSLAETAAQNDYVRPKIYDLPFINIEAGRHPVIEQVIGRENFVANDVQLGGADQDVLDVHVHRRKQHEIASIARDIEAKFSSRQNDAAPTITLITGPNMSGKSTYLRQTALIVLLAHIGSFVPARAASIGLCDRIFTRTGLYDRIGSGESTFMTEMIETAHILHHATPRSLILFDELGRGTSTYDGLAVARAVVEFIHNHTDLRSLTLFATHYHELTELESVLPRLKNLRVEIAEEGSELKFLYKVSEGAAMRSYGVYAAKLAGLPRPVVRRAQELLGEYEAATNAVTRDDSASETERMKHATPAIGAKLIDELLSLDIDSLAPVEALMKLYELRRAAQSEANAHAHANEKITRRIAPERFARP
jgi:DNA mismatch repair protein MutS